MAAGLDIKVLRMLVAIDRHGSLTRAAQALGITQSALSHHIKETERRTAVEIFHRIGKRLHLTAIGEELLQAAKAIVGEVDRIEGDLALFREGFGPVVRLGTGAYSCQAWLPRFVAALGDQGARFDIEILDNSLAFPLIKAVVDGKVDIAICGGEIDDRRVRRHHLFDDELVGVLPASHPLATRRHLEAADFAGETYLSYSTIPEKGFEDERFFRPARAMPKRWRRAGDVAMILEMVRQGLGVSILSRWAVETALKRSGLVAKRLTTKGLPTTWQAIVRANEMKDSGAVQVASRMASWWASAAGLTKT